MMTTCTGSLARVFALACLALAPLAAMAEDWPQAKLDGGRSGDAADRALGGPLGLVGAVPLSDAVFTSPAVVDGRVYVVDGSGVAWCIGSPDPLTPGPSPAVRARGDSASLAVIWRRQTWGGAANCNNTSSPAVVGDFVHFGTAAGDYYVLDRRDGAVVRRIRCGDPVFSSPVVGNGRVYFATLGGRLHAVQPDGTPIWTWDFVRERLDFDGDRWSGADWLRIRGGAGWKEQFCCTRDIAIHGKTVVMAAGGTICWVEDAGDRAELRGTYCGAREAPATLGLSLGPAGEVYRQWHRRDNGGRVEILALGPDGKVAEDFVRGTESGYQGTESLSFSSVSPRGKDVYRCRPEDGFGLCLHGADGQTRPLAKAGSICPPVLAKDYALYGALDGTLHAVPIGSENTMEPWSFATAFGRAITAAAAVCDGRVYFGCDDGYLYVLGPGGKAPLPTEPLPLEKIRSPLGGKLTGPENDWFTNFGNWANTNATEQPLRLPFRMKWIRPFHGTVKHMSVFGGGRMYTHTAEGQIFAVEQETGRLLWRRFFPGVHVSFTAPVYCDGRLLVPQAGFEKCLLRCLDAATGKLLWEAPFAGSPSWNRQLPPIVHEGRVFYQFSTGRYTPEQWLFEHQSTFGFPKDQKPLVRAWSFETGQELWTRDFSKFGAGGDDAGMCLLDGTLYYSCYFGGKGPTGVTAAIEPASGKVLWVTTDHAVHAGCTVSGADGRIYLGGYNPVEGKTNRVWCLDARDGSLVWQSDPISRAIHVVTIGKTFLFTHSQYENGYLIDKETGKLLTTLVKGFRCTRFTLCEPYLLGPDLNIFDLAQDNRLVYCGPAIDVLLCVGATASNGRIHATTNGSGLQVSLVVGEEAEESVPAWQQESSASPLSPGEG
ncbi:MAG: PQQ-binding-like beta-propeller repeat protein [Pirellulales bacterium]|nr:PQQ-binding-like beta-propeller repeat protein [Pirellulales bacterium]